METTLRIHYLLIAWAGNFSNNSLKEKHLNLTEVQDLILLAYKSAVQAFFDHENPIFPHIGRPYGLIPETLLHMKGDAISGVSLWRKFSEMKSYILNTINPIWSRCTTLRHGEECVTDDDGTRFPTGLTISEVFLKIRQHLWVLKEEHAMKKRPKRELQPFNQDWYPKEWYVFLYCGFPAGTDSMITFTGTPPSSSMLILPRRSLLDFQLALSASIGSSVVNNNMHVNSSDAYQLNDDTAQGMNDFNSSPDISSDSGSEQRVTSSEYASVPPNSQSLNRNQLGDVENSSNNCMGEDNHALITMDLGDQIQQAMFDSEKEAYNNNNNHSSILVNSFASGESSNLNDTVILRKNSLVSPLPMRLSPDQQILQHLREHQLLHQQQQLPSLISQSFLLPVTTSSISAASVNPLTETSSIVPKSLGAAIQSSHSPGTYFQSLEYFPSNEDHQELLTNGSIGTNRSSYGSIQNHIHQIPYSSGSMNKNSVFSSSTTNKLPVTSKPSSQDCHASISSKHSSESQVSHQQLQKSIRSVAAFSVTATEELISLRKLLAENNALLRYDLEWKRLEKLLQRAIALQKPAEVIQHWQQLIDDHLEVCIPVSNNNNVTNEN